MNYRRDFDDYDSVADSQARVLAAGARVRKSNADFQERAAALLQEDADRLRSGGKLIERANERVLTSEYHAQGLEPHVDASGNVVSLPLMFRLGWRIEIVSGQPKLVKATASSEFQ